MIVIFESVAGYKELLIPDKACARAGRQILEPGELTSSLIQKPTWPPWKEQGDVNSNAGSLIILLSDSGQVTVISGPQF